MSVEKVDLQSVQPETKQTFQGKKSIQHDIHESHDEEKRNAAKLMTGGVLLAGTIAAGIFCHKAGVFQKLGKMISGESSQLSKNTKNAADDAAEAVANAGKKSEEAVTEAVNSANKTTEEVKPAVTETVEQTTAKPVQDKAEKVVKETEKAAETLNKPKTLDELAEEALKAGRETFERERIDQSGKKLLEIFDTKTKKLLKDTSFYDDGKTIECISDYDPKTGYDLKWTFFAKDGKTIGCICDFDPKTGYDLKHTYFHGDGKTISHIIDFDPRRKDRKLKATDFDCDGKISCIRKYSDLSGKLQKVIYPNRGSLEFDRVTGNRLIKVDGEPI